MNILIIPSWYPTENDPFAGIFIQQQAMALKETGINISILFANLSPRFIFSPFEKPFQKVEEGILTFSLKAFAFPKRITSLNFMWLYQWDRLFQYYLEKNSRPQFIHAHSFVAGFVARFLSQKYKIPYLITEHYSGFLKDDIPAHWSKILGSIYSDAEKVIVVSQALAEKIAPYSKCLEIIPNLIDTELFHPLEKKTAPPPFRIITVGSLIPRKNQALLLKVFARLSSEEDIRLTIVGAGPLLANLQALSKNLRISGLINFTGALPPKQVAAEIQKSHLFILTSETETFGIVLAEAMACGLPIVATKCGGAEEVAKNKESIIVQTHSIEALAKAIKKQLYASNDQLAIRHYAVNKFSVPVVANQIFEIYKKLGKV